jgi:defect-in-organelle-trafficking protein DotB
MIKPTFTLEAFRYSKEEVDRLLVWGHEAGASDFQFLPNEAPWMRLFGEWYRPCSTIMSASEIKDFLNQSSRSPSSAAQVESGNDVDYAYEIKVDRATRLRFRANATGCRDGWEIGAAMVLRTIPSTPPRLEDLDVEQGIWDAIMPAYGLVLVTGPVGSGKTTLLAATLRSILENQPRNVLTYEAPIEFDLVGISPRKGAIVQTEIPSALREFGKAPRNSLRRAGDVVLFGESRDKETIRDMTIVAETGVAVYTTVHTNSVSETISRMVREFPYEERDGMSATLLSSIRLIVHQRLLRTVDGKRVAVREFLAFDDATRSDLYSVPNNQLIPEIHRMVERKGQTLMKAIEREYAKGTISKEVHAQMAAILAASKPKEF